MYYVYLLRSKKDGKYYIGQTKDIDERLNRHNKGWVKSTKGRSPFELVYYEASKSLKDARRRELYLKTAWGKRYLKNRIRQYLESI